MTLPQIRGMYFGDRARKQTLVDHGFRLPSAMDNRPLKFDEFEDLSPQTVYVSATPSEFELQSTEGVVVEQVIRPTGLVDPPIEIRPARGQVQDLLELCKVRAERKERVLVTALTKRLCEELTGWLDRQGVRVRYLHSEIDTLERLIKPAKEAGVVLAVESRSKYEDVPDEREMIALQEHFKECPQIGYWHDFGHVGLKHNLGLLDHDQWLEKMAPYLIGSHLHDVQWPKRDHRVPFTGSLPYDQLLRHFKPEMPFTWELSPTRKTEQILTAFDLWKRKFPETLKTSTVTEAPSL